MDRIEKLRELLQKDPSDNFVQHALALEYVKLGDDVEARKMFEALLIRDPRYVGSYYHLAKLLERKGALEEAIKWYEQGMHYAKEMGEMHAFEELRSAWEELSF